MNINKLQMYDANMEYHKHVVCVLTITIESYPCSLYRQYLLFSAFLFVACQGSQFSTHEKINFGQM